MRVVEIKDEQAMRELRPAWNALLSESPSRNIFLTWEWLSAWWSAYGNPGELRLLAAWDESETLRGIAPLRSKVLRKYGQTVPVLAFAGDAPFNSDSDYLDFATAAGYEDQALAAFGRHLAGELSRGTVLELNEIPETSPNLPVLKKLARARDLSSVETDVPCAVIRLPRSWEEYLAMLKPRFRTKARSILRNMENRPEIRFGFASTHEDIDRLLPILFDLHTRRWQQEGKPGVFGDPRKRDFYAKISRILLERGWLRFSYLEWNGHVLACQYGFVYGDVYSQLQEGYEPASEHLNLGAALRAWTIREYISQGLREYDFLGGVNRHKTDWGAGVKQSKRLQLACESPRNLLFLNGPKWMEGLRSSVRDVLPEKILEARRAALQKPAAGPDQTWMRQAAARLYFHSGAPALFRRVRDRYQLSMQPNGMMPKMSLQKREQTSARIFCYHRINDENDPFFTATSTAVFENQIRYLSQHYNVVSMAELSRRLETGGPLETVVAITFDDGYRDNYEHAFPILQRYGVPATIFLTTGTIESGEPLWFERLAEAVKKTDKEFLDLEREIPRRFWLRNEAERVNSHLAIFNLLRELSNQERHHWLAVILGQLGTPATSERQGKMLTWEQVRVMSRQQIDFGGHTVTHPFLSRLTAAEAAWEVGECKRHIEEELQQPARFFAYPNGRHQDYSPAHKELLREVGYQGAVTTIWGPNYASTDRMELRRGGPWEENPALFAMKLDWYQLVNE